jgi:hypothetical protein
MKGGLGAGMELKKYPPEALLTRTIMLVMFIAGR